MDQERDVNRIVAVTALALLGIIAISVSFLAVKIYRAGVPSIVIYEPEYDQALARRSIERAEAILKYRAATTQSR